MNHKKATLFRIYEENPEMRKIEKIVEILRNGGVVIYPTDTIYAIGCDFNSPRSAELLARIKGGQSSKLRFSLICHDISMVSEYAKSITTPVYKVLKKGLPGQLSRFFCTPITKCSALSIPPKKQLGYACRTIKLHVPLCANSETPS